MDFSLGLRLGPRNKKATYQEPPPSSGRGPPATSPCLPCPPTACACPCPSCPPLPCSCTACPSDAAAATCPSCPGLPGPPCTCSCPPCPACPPSMCPHTYCLLCSGPSMTYCRPSPCPIYSCHGSQTACRSSHLGCSSGCSCSRGVAWGPRDSTGYCGVCFRSQKRASRGLCQII
uniref:Predicted gene 9918 n=1 Tax=Mus spicilegus TaxID=10103 RepID=A0A8C6N2B2_MUSSI